jgi:hypothetical protein
VAEYSSDFRPPAFVYKTLRSALAPSFLAQAVSDFAQVGRTRTFLVIILQVIYRP